MCEQSVVLIQEFHFIGDKVTFSQRGLLERADIGDGGKVLRAVALQQQAMKADVIAHGDNAGKAMGCKGIEDPGARIGGGARCVLRS